MKHSAPASLFTVPFAIVLGCSGSPGRGGQPDNPVSTPPSTVVGPATAGPSEPAADEGEPMVVAAPSGPTGDVHAGAADLPVEVCDTDSPSAVHQDMNGDGRPDVVKVVEGGRLRCRVMDLDFDGRFDITEFHDAAGQLRRREVDFDFDGRPDEVSLHAGAQLLEKRMDTTRDGRFDLRDVYVNGRRERRERDVDGDGRVDEWWTYLEAEPDCARVRSDTDGDGRPDGETKVCGQ